MLLCAGLGTRLRPLTTQVPKPLVPVGDRPLVDHAVGQLRVAGVRHFELNAFHLAAHIQEYATRAAADGECFTCTVETELRGTAGGITGMYRGQAYVIVWNGDIYAPDLNVADLLSHADEAAPLLVVSRFANGGAAGSGGTLGLGPNETVVRLRGQHFGEERSEANYVGIAVLPRAFVETLPGWGCVVADGLIPWLAGGKRVNTYEYIGHWSDGGTIEHYLAQNLEWLRRQPNAAESYAGPHSACGPQVTLSLTVLGDGVKVSGAGELRRCVVWPGAAVEAPLRDAVVLSDGVIVRSPLPSQALLHSTSPLDGERR